MNKSWNIYIAKISFLLMYIFIGSSFGEEIIWKNFNVANTSKNGLCSEYVNDIKIDKSGNIWFATSYGISRFDGKNWIGYSITEGLAGNDIEKLIFDKYDNLWAISSDKGVSMYDGNKWNTFTKENSGLPTNYVWFVKHDKDKNLWFCSGEGAAMFDGQNWVTYTTENSGLIHNHIRDIAFDDEGNIWFGTDLGICKFDGKSWGNYFYYHVASGDSIIFDKDDNVWVNHWWGNGVACFDGKDWKIYTTANSGLPYDYVRSIVLDRNKNLWFLTYKGVAMFDGQSWTTYTSVNSGLIDSDVKDIAFDDEGNIWFGTFEGISKFDGKNWISYSLNDDYYNNWINDIVLDKKGNIWADIAGYMYMFDGYKFKSISEINRELPKKVHSIIVDKDKNLWFATSKGVAMFDGYKWKFYPLDNKYLPSNYINSICVDKYNNIWVATNKGVSRFDGKDWHCENRFNTSYITMDKKGNIWSALYGYFNPATGVMKYDGKNWINYNEENSGLCSNRVIEIAPDAKGNVWFSLEIYPHGVVKYDGLNWTHYNQNKTNLPIDYIRCMAADKNGGMWFGNWDGIYYFDGKDKWIRYIPKDWGMETNTVQDISVDSKGNVWCALYQGYFGNLATGVMKFDGLNWTNELPNDSVKMIHADDKGRIILDAYGFAYPKISSKEINKVHCLIIYSRGKWTAYNLEEIIVPRYGYIYITSINTDKDGNIWLGTRHRGVYMLSIKEEVEDIENLRGSNITYLYNCPNPFKENTHFIYYLTDDADFANISIYNISGELVKVIKKVPRFSGKNVVFWNGKNEYGQRVASGVYVYLLTAVFNEEKKIKVNKLVVLR